MTITVTGATGQLGRLVIEQLLSQGVSAASIAAVARDPQKASSLGVPVREADYFQPETLKKPLLVRRSCSSFPQVTPTSVSNSTVTSSTPPLPLA